MVPRGVSPDDGADSARPAADAVSRRRILSALYSRSDALREARVLRGTPWNRRAKSSICDEQYPEESRLQHGAGPLEFERTKLILSAVLPPPPARVLDVGGAAGAYSEWLAGQGFDVHLVDASARLVGEARRRNVTLPRPIASLAVADARALPAANGSAGALLLMGPLYHLTAAADRAAALREALRVLAPSGVVAVAAISRFASALDGLAQARGADEAFVRLRDRDLRRRAAPQRRQTSRVLRPRRTCITPTSSGTRSKPPDSNRSPCMVSKGRPGWWATSTASGRIPPCAVTSCTWRPRSNVNQA